MCARINLFVALVLVGPSLPLARADDPLAIVGPAKAAPYTLLEFRPSAMPAGAVADWTVSPEDRCDVRELADGRLILTGPPGAYRLRLRVDQVMDGRIVRQSARAAFTIGDPPPVPPPPPDKPKSQTPACIGRLRVGNSGCTATPIWPRRADGKWDVLTAAHCTAAVGTKGTLTMKDGKTLEMTVSARNTRADISWFVTDRSDIDQLAYGVLAASDPPPGAPVWQAGYGVSTNTVRKDGVTRGATPDGQLSFTLFVSSGDSGGPIFRTDTSEIVACVCCTQGLGRETTMYGGSSTTAWQMRPGAVSPRDDDDHCPGHPGFVHPVERLRSTPALPALPSPSAFRPS